DSIDLVLTDPPYTDLEAWDDLGKLCQKVLKPKGCLVAYAGKYLARQVMNTLSKHFVVEPWPICIPFKGPSRLTYPHRGHIVDKWQMLLFYQEAENHRLTVFRTCWSQLGQKSNSTTTKRAGQKQIGRAHV